MFLAGPLVSTKQKLGILTVWREAVEPKKLKLFSRKNLYFHTFSLSLGLYMDMLREKGLNFSNQTFQVSDRVT